MKRLLTKGQNDLFVINDRSIQPLIFLELLFIITFCLYSVVDYLNLFLHLYPIYNANALYGTTMINEGNGAADLKLFYTLGNMVLQGQYFSTLSNLWDGGPFAPIVYAVPVFVSQRLNLDPGYCFRILYLGMLISAGRILYQIAIFFLSPKKAFFLSIGYVYNPFIFILSVWVGNEEIIETFLLLLVILFLQTHHYNYSLIFCLLAISYKYYSVLFIFLIIMSIPETHKRIKVFILFLGAILVSTLLLIIFFPSYFFNIFNLFVVDFPDRGKGLIPFFIQWGWLNTSPTTSFVYFSLLSIIIAVTSIYMCQTTDIERFGILLLIFFLGYPEFYVGYLVIPFAFLQFFFIKNKYLWLSYILFSIPAILSQFAFTDAVSIYSLFQINPNNFLIMIGLVNLIIIYLITILWTSIYVLIYYKRSNRTN